MYVYKHICLHLHAVMCGKKCILAIYVYVPQCLYIIYVYVIVYKKVRFRDVPHAPLAIFIYFHFFCIYLCASGHLFARIYRVFLMF